MSEADQVVKSICQSYARTVNASVAVRIRVNGFGSETRSVTVTESPPSTLVALTSRDGGGGAGGGGGSGGGASIVTVGLVAMRVNPLFRNSRNS